MEIVEKVKKRSPELNVEVETVVREGKPYEAIVVPGQNLSERR